MVAIGYELLASEDGRGGAPNGRERVYYPQFCATLKVRLEDFSRGAPNSDKRLDEFYELQVIPKRCTVNINDYSQADTFEMELNYKDFPFDPRCIRAVGVSIHAQDMYRIYDSSNSRPKIVPNQENVIFFGFADEDTIEFNDTDRVVKLEGRDNTSLFIDEKYPMGTVPLTKTVDEVLRQIIDVQPATRAMRLDNRVGLLPVLSSFYSDKHEGSGHKNVKRDQSYWDVIQDIVRQAGLIAYIEIDKLVISKPRILYDKSQAKTFIYGHNVKDLSFKRKIGRRKNFNLAVRGMNIEGKRPPVFTAKLPLEATPAWSRETGIPQGEVKLPELDAEGKPVAEPKAAPYITFLIPNVASQAHLVELGQQLYEEISRQQIEGSFSTRDLSTTYQHLNADGVPTGASEVSFDVLKLRNGTPISIVIDDGDIEGLSNLASAAERTDYLVRRGWNQKVAAIFAETLGKHSNTFYTREVKIQMSQDDGISFDIEFLNFIEVSERFRGKV